MDMFHGCLVAEGIAAHREHSHRLAVVVVVVVVAVVVLAEVAVMIKIPIVITAQMDAIPASTSAQAFRQTKQTGLCRPPNCPRSSGLVPG
jgi:hypothetical protein